MHFRSGLCLCFKYDGYIKVRSGMEGVKKRKQSIIAVCVSLIFLIGVISIYVHELSRVVSKATIGSMEELSLHDSQSIQNYLDDTWSSLDSIAKRLRLYQCTTIEDVQERLNLETASCGYDSLYLLGDDGNAYYASYLIRPADDFILRQFKENSTPFAVRSDGSAGIQLESKKEALLYGVGMDSMKVGEVTFIGLAAQSEVSAIADHLKIDSFDGRGYSSVIDADGNYIVNMNRKTSFGEQENFFSLLEEGTLKENVTVEAIKEKTTNNEKVSFSYTTPDGDERVLTILPMENSDWLFVMSVSQSVFNEQAGDIILMTTIMMGVILLVVCGMLFLLIRSETASFRAKSEANARAEFLSNMSHEIRTPLNGLVGLNHLMGVCVDDREKLLEYIRKSGDTAQYLLSLVNDILDMSKLQAGRFEMVNEPFDVADMLDNVRSMQRENIAGREVRFEMSTDLKAPYIVGDALRIKQVVMNVLSNAAKFTPKGGSIRLTARQQLLEDNRVSTVISVADTGIGISKEFQKQIFSSFSQERNKNTESQKGTGLGMSISYLLMKQMGGSISVESELGKGSTFTIEFTAETADAPAAPEAETAVPEKSGGDRKPVHVLLAEDNALNAEILLEILGMEGFQVTHAKDGAEAVKLFEASGEYAYDVILMDVQMPVMDGYEATRKIRGLSRADAQSVLIYACTANAFKEDQDRALASGMNDFLTKPIDVKELIRKMEQLSMEGEKP